MRPWHPFNAGANCLVQKSPIQQAHTSYAELVKKMREKQEEFYGGDKQRRTSQR